MSADSLNEALGGLDKAVENLRAAAEGLGSSDSISNAVHVASGGMIDHCRL